jgi:hypothetical protein
MFIADSCHLEETNDLCCIQFFYFLGIQVNDTVKRSEAGADSNVCK